ncbi:MAG: hypothetical protein COW52_09610 [Nitrospirae bacterium CG17_big_fil_post_rev_8_21_14_2_50_50_9]|nr:MAG: hypothetical protein COW52_09610 [Nitrospirae bacterium CG17_big_fil_post_rev_8_21_14_2_50_50_9]
MTIGAKCRINDQLAVAAEAVALVAVVLELNMEGVGENAGRRLLDKALIDMALETRKVFDHINLGSGFLDGWFGCRFGIKSEGDREMPEPLACP